MGLVLLITCWPSVVMAQQPGSGEYLFQNWAGPDLPVWYHRPESSGDDAPVVIVMHGVGRDADRYRDEWAGLAEAHGFVLLVPEFSQKDFPRSRSYNLGNTFNAEGEINDSAIWSYAAIEPLWEDYRQRSGNQSPGYRLYGHSAGAQFVHRFLYFQPQASVIRAVAANAGWYTLPDFETAWPYGLGDSPATADMLTTALARPLTILLGTADNDPEARNLRQTPEAQAQGAHRLARGENYFEAGGRAAKLSGHSIGWQLKFADGIGHDNGKMAEVAVEYLLDGG